MKNKRVNKVTARKVAAELSAKEKKTWEGEKRKSNGLFAKGNKPPPGGYRGRPYGAVARLPKILKEAALMAAEIHGSDGEGKDELVGYMFFLAKDHPVCFAGILGKILPLQVSIEDGPMVVEAALVRAVVSRLSERELKAIESIYDSPKLIDVVPEAEVEGSIVMREEA